MTKEKWPDYILIKSALKAAPKVATPSAARHTLADEQVAPSEAVESVYSVLTTLDAKASALMRLNGVLIAAAAFMLGLFGRESILATSSVDAIAVVFAAFLSAGSITLCLLVVNVSWNFLGRITKSGSEYSFEAEIVHLCKAMMFRQRTYRWAWNVSLLAAAIFLAEYLRQTIHIASRFA